MVALPTESALARPELVTEATVAEEEDQVTELFVFSSTVAVTQYGSELLICTHRNVRGIRDRTAIEVRVGGRNSNRRRPPD